jgi:predicted nucleic acid-binding protein
MPAYVDSSVIVAALIGENRASEAQSLLRSDDVVISSWLTYVEVRRNLLWGTYRDRVRQARLEFDEQINLIELIDVVEADWRSAADIAESTQLKSLDAVHLAVANKFNPEDVSFLTFDKKQASVARQMGFSVVGA